MKNQKQNDNNFIKGMTLKEHFDELNERLFNEYLPYWDKGGYDEQYGGFICHLDQYGIPVDDEKYIWYQGRAIWLYSYLYRNFGNNPKYLEIAQKTRDFMVNYLYKGNGQWAEAVKKDGKLLQGIKPDSDIYGWLFAAEGLAEYYRIRGNSEDLQLFKESIMASVKAYDSPEYLKGTEMMGWRFQGHSMVFVWVLTQFLDHSKDEELEKLRDFHLNKIMNFFYNPKYNIANEELSHVYSRMEGKEVIMCLGHSIETMWMVMYAALQKKDTELFKCAKNNFKSYIEMGWDYNFGGLGSEDYYIFDSMENAQGADYSIKTMWAHTEILIGCMIVIEHTDECWAKDWYERAWEYIKKYFSLGVGTWEQAVDRYGKLRSREKWGIHPMRRGNYHQPRFLMMNILSLDRMINKSTKNITSNKKH